MASSSDPAADETIKESQVPRNLNNQAGVGDSIDRVIVAASLSEADVEDALQQYVTGGFRGIIASPHVAGAAILSAIGGLLFGMYNRLDRLQAITTSEQFLAFGGINSVQAMTRA